MSKNKEAAKITIAKIENAKAIDIAKNLLRAGLSVQMVAENTELGLVVIQKLRDELEKGS